MKQWWVHIDRDHSNDLAVGPYPSKDAADHAVGYAGLIDGICAEDCLDLTVEDHAHPGYEQVVIDPTDPHHTGEGETVRR